MQLKLTLQKNIISPLKKVKNNLLIWVCFALIFIEILHFIEISYLANVCSKPGKLAPSQNPSLFSQEIQVIFEMKLYIAGAVLLRGMNLEFFSVISLKTAQKKKSFLYLMKKEKPTDCMQVT